MGQDHHTSHARSLLNHLRPSMKRESGGTQYHDRVHGEAKRMRLFLPIVGLLLGIVVISLHAAGGLFLLKTGLDGFSLHNPLASVLIGLSLVLAVFKLKHVVVMHTKQKTEGAGKAGKA